MFVHNLIERPFAAFVRQLVEHPSRFWRHGVIYIVAPALIFWWAIPELAIAWFAVGSIGYFVARLVGGYAPYRQQLIDEKFERMVKELKPPS